MAREYRGILGLVPAAGTKYKQLLSFKVELLPTAHDVLEQIVDRDAAIVFLILI